MALLKEVAVFQTVVEVTRKYESKDFVSGLNIFELVLHFHPTNTFAKFNFYIFILEMLSHL